MIDFSTIEPGELIWYIPAWHEPQHVMYLGINENHVSFIKCLLNEKIIIGYKENFFLDKENAYKSLEWHGNNYITKTYKKQFVSKS